MNQFSNTKPDNWDSLQFLAIYQDVYSIMSSNSSKWDYDSRESRSNADKIGLAIPFHSALFSMTATNLAAASEQEAVNYIRLWIKA